MPLVKRIRRRGANIVVVAAGEVLFAPNGDVSNWMRRFSARARARAAMEAPANKRPRWAHYGKPLKTTMRASTESVPSRMRVYAAVGSTAPYSAYVDQGTGVYAGNGPYPAKILPPWRRGSPSLYESTWGVGGNRVGAVMIKGQKGQFFFDKALGDTFRSFGIPNATLPGDGVLGDAITSMPDRLEGFLGNTPWSFAFDAQLREWRSWRDAAFNAGRVLGTESGRRNRQRSSRALGNRPARMTQERRRAQWRRASKRYREQQRRMRTTPTRSERAKALRAERAQVLAGAVRRYGAQNVDANSLKYAGGRWSILVRVKDDRGRNVWVEKSVGSRV